MQQNFCNVSGDGSYAKFTALPSISIAFNPHHHTKLWTVQTFENFVKLNNSMKFVSENDIFSWSLKIGQEYDNKKTIELNELLPWMRVYKYTLGWMNCLNEWANKILVIILIRSVCDYNTLCNRVYKWHEIEYPKF